jgi:hypothetical protein
VRKLMPKVKRFCCWILGHRLQHGYPPYCLRCAQTDDPYEHRDLDSLHLLARLWLRIKKYLPHEHRCAHCHCFLRMGYEIKPTDCNPFPVEFCSEHCQDNWLPF